MAKATEQSLNFMETMGVSPSYIGNLGGFLC